MDLEKFCLFFERSNSKGVTLNFIDIIVAKIYIGFNLRKQIEEIKDENRFPIDNHLTEAFVRYISFLVENKVDKKTILESLNHTHFERYWYTITGLFEKTINYLVSQRLLIGYEWLRYKTMYIPMMHYLKSLPHQDFSQQTEEQLKVFKFWYFSSLLNARYGGGMIGSTNVIIAEDCKFLELVAKNKKIDKSLVKKFKNEFDPNDLHDLNSRGAVFTGIIMLMHNKNELKDWANGGLIDTNNSLNVHHIFPKKFVSDTFGDKSDEFEKVDSVLNKAIIGKLSNQKYASKSPSTYLNETPIVNNKKIHESLNSHLIPSPEKLINGDYDLKFKDFLKDRYNLINELIDKEVLSTQDELIKKSI